MFLITRVPLVKEEREETKDLLAMMDVMVQMETRDHQVWVLAIDSVNTR